MAGINTLAIIMYSFQVLFTFILGVLIVRRFARTKIRSLYGLFKARKLAAWSNVLFALVLAFQIILNAVIPVIVYESEDPSEAEAKQLCPQQPGAAYQCLGNISRLLQTGSTIELFWQASSVAIWCMYVDEWVGILRPPRWKMYSNMTAGFCLLNTLLAIGLGFGSYGLDACAGGCITDTSYRLSITIQVQIGICIGIASIFVCLVSVSIARTLLDRSHSNASFKYIGALCVAAVLFLFHCVVRLLGLNILLSHRFIWALFLPENSASDATDAGYGANASDTHALLIGLWAFSSLLPLIIVHVMSDAISNDGERPGSFHIRLAGAFEHILSELAVPLNPTANCGSGAEDQDGMRMTLEPASLSGSGLTEFFDLEDLSQIEQEAAACVVHQQEPLVGTRVIEMPGSTLTIVDTLAPCPVAFQCAEAYLRYRIQETEEAFHQTLLKWNTALDKVEKARTRESLASGGTLMAAMSSLQEDSAYRELRSWVKTYGHKWQDYMDHLEDMLRATQLWNWREVLLFKPSTHKSTRVAACIPTNLQRYTLRVSQDMVGMSVSAAVDEREATFVEELSMTTVGAFAAHHAGFAQGGLSALVARAEVALSAPMPEGARVDARLGREMEIANTSLDIHMRISSVFPQALCTATSTLLAAVREALQHGNLGHIKQWCEIGYLFEMHSLLSTQGNETGMLEDMIQGMCMLSDTSVVLVEGGKWRVWRERDKINVRIPLEKREMKKMRQLQADLDFRICFVPCLFTLGVNEKQTLANALPGIGDPKLQAKVNRDGLRTLEAYWQRFHGSNGRYAPLPWVDISHNTVSGKRSKWRTLADLVEDHEPSEKDVNLLLDSAMLCRAVNGGRVTCCKSAKDRTSMASTLEFATALVDMGLLGEGEEANAHMLTLLDSLRRITGCRLQNCHLNTGKAQYAFNVFQQSTLPELLKPPADTAGKNVS
eukprot:TRINITY_DN5456_c0_g1_i6.p1 TRINITY_DN5456_c0_g1~~TRINITY_DN5456_c0_g1_i6.p1  ORF type:complete len:945 (+),score=183.02 TRINITY_DN5456_c0_g1_i6:228-3062(+)